MWTRALALAVATTSLVLGASACGGDDSDASSEAAPVIEQIKEICDAWRDKADERGDFPVDGFDPENPSPADLPAVGDYFAAGHPAAEEAIAELRALSPPAEIQADVEALIAALERQLEGGRRQANAAQAADVSAFTASLDGAVATREAITEATNELGTPECAF